MRAEWAEESADSGHWQTAIVGQRLAVRISVEFAIHPVLEQGVIQLVGEDEGLPKDGSNADRIVNRVVDYLGEGVRELVQIWPDTETGKMNSITDAATI